MNLPISTSVKGQANVSQQAAAKLKDRRPSAETLNQSISAAMEDQLL
jgi:hypothetical protein